MATTAPPISLAGSLLLGEDVPVSELPTIGARSARPSAPAKSEAQLALEEFMADVQTNGIDPTSLPQPEQPGILERLGDSALQSAQLRQQAQRAATQAIEQAVQPGLQRVGEAQLESSQLQRQGETGAAETALSIGTGAVGAVLGGAQQLGRVVAGLGHPFDPQYYSKLSNAAKRFAAEVTYQPRTEVGQTLLQPVQSVMEVLHDFSAAASEAPIVRMFTTPDQRVLVRDAHEFLTMFAADVFVRNITPAIRNRVQNFAEQYRNIETPEAGPAIVNSARELIAEVNVDPVLGPAIDAGKATINTIRRVESTPNIDPTLKPRLRDEGREILRRVNDNPENPQAIADALAYVERTRNLIDPIVEDVNTAIRREIPSRDIGSSSTVISGSSLETPAQASVQVREGINVPALENAGTAKQRLDLALGYPEGHAARRKMLSEIKAEARATLTGRENLEVGLERIGLSPEDISANITELRSVRAARRPRSTQPVESVPTVSAQEPRLSALEEALGITPDLPDTSPAITKPKKAPPVASSDSSIADPAFAPIAQELAAARRAVREATTPEATAAAEARLRAATEAFSEYSLTAPAPELPTRSRSATSNIETTGVRPVTREEVETTRSTIEPASTASATTSTSGTGAIQANEIASLFSEMGKGITDNLYQSMLDRLTQGKLPDPFPENAQSSFGRLAKQQFDQGNINSVEDLRLLARDRKAFDLKVAFDNGDIRSVTPVTEAQAGEYVAARTAPVGETRLSQIVESLDKGTDIARELDPALRQHVQDVRSAQTSGIDSSSPRGAGDIIGDLLEIVLPSDARISGSPSILNNQRGSLTRYGLTPNQRNAIARLKADALRQGIKLREILDRTPLPEAAKILYERYADIVNTPPPPSGINPRNMHLDPEAIARGDTLSYQRKRGNKNYPPVYEAERDAIINAGNIAPDRGLGRINANTGLLVPYFALREAGLLDTIGYGYRRAENAYIAERKELISDLRAVRRSLGGIEREAIGRYGYNETSQGQSVLNRRGIPAVQELTPAEQAVYNTGRNLFNDLFTRVNEVRQAIGRDPLPVPDNHTVFMRTFTLSERLGLGTNLLFDTPAKVQATVNRLANTDFPTSRFRPGATLSAELDYTRLLDRYSQAALRQIHVAPFTAKLNELINHPLIDPNTGKLTFRLKQANPDTYRYLEDLKNFLITGDNGFRLPRIVDTTMRQLMNNLAFSMLSGTVRSGLVQISTLRNTYQDLGLAYTARGIYDNYSDLITGGNRREFALKNSQVLNSRTHIEAFNEFADAIIGGNTGDFLRAIRRGNVGEVQAAAGNAGLKFLELMDREAALNTWQAAYRHGQDKLNLTGTDLINYADDAVVRTQGGTMPGDIAAIQRNTLGRLVTQFQRFVIHDWNFLVNDVLGRRNIERELNTNPRKTLRETISNIVRFTAATTAFNILYEDIIGTNSPFPTPIRDVNRSLEGGESLLEAAMVLAGNTVEPLPLFSSARFGRGISGPVVETFRDVTRSAAGEPLSYEVLKDDDDLVTGATRIISSPAGRLAGVPFANQAGKYLRGRERGQSAYTALVGRYDPNERAQQPTRRPLTSSGGLRRTK